MHGTTGAIQRYRNSDIITQEYYIYQKWSNSTTLRRKLSSIYHRFEEIRYICGEQIKDTTMTQLVINVENKNLLPGLRRILNALEGVTIEKAPRRKRKSGLDLAIDDIHAGRVYSAKNIDDLLQKELGV
jgi:hypothetical protein